MTMNIATVKMDDKGRITLPTSFLKANNIDIGGWVIIKPVYNDNSACKLKFRPRKATLKYSDDKDRKKEVTDGVAKNNG